MTPDDTFTPGELSELNALISLPREKNPAAVALGQLGGRAGRGPAKARSSAAMRRAQKIGVAARKKRLMEKNKA